MKRKLISLLLALSMMISLFVIETSAADGFTDIAGLPCETAVNYLAEAGIVNGRSEGIYAPGEGLTRAEMVAIILRAYGSKEIEDIEKFRDVPPTHWAYMYVETAYKMGIVNGMTETTFVPDGAVTYEQAVKMLVCAMNRGKNAEEEGGWPDGYIKVAADLGVLEGVDGQKGQAITRGTMAQLVYNCLNAEVGYDYMINWDGVAEHYNWIRDEKIRCIYGHSPTTLEGEDGVLKRLENAGINTIFLNINDTDMNSSTEEGWAAGLDRVVKLLDQKYNFHDFIKINFGDNGYTRNNAYGTFHPGIYKESYFNSPCPLVKEYWDHQFLERTLLIASYPTVEGIILDFEMYSGGTSQYTSACMCDQCWLKYIEAKGYPAEEWGAVEAINRSAFVIEKNKSVEYKEWFEDEIVKLFAYIREETHKVNPEIIFGYFPGFEWLPGMTEGLGTPEKPVLVASEVEYWGSLASTAETMLKINENEDMHAIYCPGLFPSTTTALNPTQLEEKIKQAAPTTAGYWMYAAQTLREDEGHYTAVANANAALDEMLRTGDLQPLPEYEIREYTANKIAGETPTVEEWEAAPFTEDFVHYQQGEEGTVPVDSRAKVLYSDDEFFVRVYAYDTMKNVSVGAVQPHDGNPWAGDCVEFFWRFDGSTDAAQLVADLAGSTWDAYCTGVATKNTNVNFEGFSATTELFSDHWEMTMRIPGTLDGIKKIQQGEVLRVEIGRYHPASRAKGEIHNHCWAPTYGSYQGSPSLWGYVTLG